MIQPSSQPRSTMAHSIVLMVTGLSSMLSVQAASHGAGQMRPVNSGKLLVECRTLERVLPLLAIDQVVPVRDQVVDRTAVVTERDAAIHAARGLVAQRRLGQRLDELLANVFSRSSGSSIRRDPGARSRESRLACPSVSSGRTQLDEILAATSSVRPRSSSVPAR